MDTKNILGGGDSVATTSYGSMTSNRMTTTKSGKNPKRKRQSGGAKRATKHRK